MELVLPFAVARPSVRGAIKELDLYFRRVSMFSGYCKWVMGPMT